MTDINTKLEEPIGCESTSMSSLLESMINAAVELADYTSYAEIIGCVRHNRQEIRKMCDTVRIVNYRIKHLRAITNEKTRTELEAQPEPGDSEFIEMLARLRQAETWLKDNDKKKHGCWRSAGLESIVELAEISGESVETLSNWYKNHHRRFELILKGAIAEKFARGIENI